MSLDAERAQSPFGGRAGQRVLTGIALACVLALAACSGSGASSPGPVSSASAGAAAVPTSPASAPQTLSETGSSLMAPLFSFWRPAQAYPIVNYEYAVVNTAQPSATRAEDLRAFLSRAITRGTAQLARVHFEPLPYSVVTLSVAQIAKIKG